MAALLPQFVVDLETDMQEIVQASYGALLQELWWTDVAKVRSTGARKDILFWMIDTFTLRSEGKEGGNKHFEELISQQTEIEHEHVGGGIILKNDQLLDQDGRGLDQAANWSRQAGAQMAYWPQDRCNFFLQNAHNLGTSGGFTAYDTKAFFATDHPVNPKKASAGSYANLLTGAAAAASGNTPAYPGACPIDDSVDLDVALVNLGKIFSYMASIRQPNGRQPRGLRPDKILVGPRMFPRVVQLTSAKFLAQVAGSGAGSADVASVIKALGYATPVMCAELAGFESDTTFFVTAKTLAADPFGAIVYTQREPFSINFFGVMTERELKQRNELEYHVDGRNSVTPGHPYLLFKCKGS